MSRDYVANGRMGGLTTAAITPDLRKLTEPARNARWQKYLNRVPPEITDEAERIKRAEMLRRADMIRMARKSAEARAKRP